jgi:Holliday junction resolvase RusA-like endonuclease
VSWRRVACFEVSGDPVAQPRPRAYVRPDGKASVHDNQKSRPWKAVIIGTATFERVPRGLTGPIRLQIWFMLPRPKRLLRPSSPYGLIPHVNVPDIDNLDKAVMDALSEYGVWNDDRQVCQLVSSKWYRGREKKPGATIVVDRLDEDSATQDDWEDVVGSLMREPVVLGGT